MQDTGKFRKNERDQYYTQPTIAKACVDIIRNVCRDVDSYQWIEPAAGNGVFLKAVGDLRITQSCLGIDIEPASPDVVCADFLTWLPNRTDAKIICFGNPPFGRQSSLARAFIKHASTFSELIAFILPRSFVKPSMTKAFPLSFHCIHSSDIPKHGFEVNGQSYDVPCVFQIWQKRETDRIVDPPILAKGFTYVKYGEPFDIACKRVGGLAGKCYPSSPTAMNDFHREYHYFIKLDEKKDVNDVNIISKIIETMNTHTFPTNTVGPRSLSKGEINVVLNEIIISICV